MGRWHVIVTGDKLVDELRRAPDGVLSIATAFDEVNVMSNDCYKVLCLI